MAHRRRTGRTLLVLVVASLPMLLGARTSTAGATVRLPVLPAPDGTPLLDRVDQRMHALGSYAIDETLGPLDPPLRAAYEFAVPDRMHLRLENGAETIRIGEKSWQREGPGRPWSVQSFPPLEVPNFVWDQPRRRGVKVVGHESVEGVDTSVVSLFASTLGGTEIWYRLWVDAEGLMRRTEMLAAGHFMDERFSEFDAPLVIEPPEVTP